MHFTPTSASWLNQVERFFAEITRRRIRRGSKACGWSAMIPPYIYSLTAYLTEDTELFQIKQTDLQGLCETNARVGYIVMKNIAQIVVERYEIAWKTLQGEIQQDLKKKENKTLWKAN